MRVIFIGMHNKPGLQPLCSSTRSGKVIDQIIERVPVACVKANLIDGDCIPDDFDPQANAELFMHCMLIGCDDILVLLGRFVWEHSKGIGGGAKVEIYHPAYPKSQQAKDKYVLEALSKIAPLIMEVGGNGYYQQLGRNFSRQISASMENHNYGLEELL